ncbi:UMP-CMP kinase [Cantharellus anzutake]|uniref:UMP-CMP kinase n=1 Tax=Cantharellus anzutake TaxID=1750568 RepID=UPI001904BF3D|nr:UMP-CMP kinase [Cantharellus anzutake]KAF8344328.1 UMP-CMP kinase [Cantharellus anzutake]
MVVYVLGGPGAGKGTQCASLVSEYDFVHLSAGDLLRAEQKREGSQYGALIAEYIREGQVVPMEVTIKLLENAMKAAFEERKNSDHSGWTNGKGRFLIDGFPRKMDQALKFDEDVCPASFVLFFNCPEQELLKRLLERGKTSGRTDDNEESIKKRFKTFIETSMPVVDHYRAEGRVVEIDATPPVETVHTVVRAAMDAAFAVEKSKTL